MHYLTENILFEHLKFNDENVEVDEELFNCLLSYINKNSIQALSAPNSVGAAEGLGESGNVKFLIIIN